MKSYNIGIDCMGFENPPSEAIKAAFSFWRKNRDVHFTLFGDEKHLAPYALKKHPSFEFIYTKSVINQDDSMITARRKTDASMMVGLDYLKDNKVDALISAGSSGSFVTFSYIKIGTFAKLSKPAFMPYMPTINRKGVNILDVGAAISQTAQDIYNLAVIGKIYANKIRNIPNPIIGVLNIGTESSKGPPVLQEADKLIRNDSSINYYGFIESRYIMNEYVDVVVCDGYAGNLVLKAAEGSLKTVGKLLKKSIICNPLSLLFSFNFFRKILRTFDYKNNAGAIVIGLKKLAVKTHGSADKKQFYSTISLTYKSLKNQLINCLAEEFA